MFCALFSLSLARLHVVELKNRTNNVVHKSADSGVPLYKYHSK